MLELFQQDVQSWTVPGHVGGIPIADGTRIGANAVVIEDVREGATEAGVPARVIDTNRINFHKAY